MSGVPIGRRHSVRQACVVEIAGRSGLARARRSAPPAKWNLAAPLVALIEPEFRRPRCWTNTASGTCSSWSISTAIPSRVEGAAVGRHGRHRLRRKGWNGALAHPRRNRPPPGHRCAICQSRTVSRPPRVDPYLLYAAGKHPEVADTIRDIADGIESARIALMHGDVSPKNILCGPKGPVFLDAETTPPMAILPSTSPSV